MKKKLLSARFWHKWSGIVAAVWLLVLGFTGFMIDHREWHWLWHSTVSESWIPERVVKNARSSVVRVMRVNPQKPDQQLAGGERGFWRSTDNGANWTTPSFEGLSPPPTILALENDPASVSNSATPWTIWLGSDDGLWRSTDDGQHFSRIAFAGERITSLNSSGNAGEMLGIIDRTQPFRLTTAGTATPTHTPTLIPLQALETPPPHVTLGRYLHDVHVGRGITSHDVSLLLNDFGGLAWLVLAITGLLYWLLPKAWNRRKQAGKPVAAHTRRQWLVWLFNTHSSTIGMLALIPTFYLSLSGVYFGHMSDLGNWARSIKVSQSWLTPAFALKRWDDTLEGIAILPASDGKPEQLLVAAKLGLYASSDAGKTWQRQDAGKIQIEEARRLTQAGQQLILPIAAAYNPNAQAEGHAAHQPTPAKPGNNMGGMGGGMMGGMSNRIFIKQPGQPWQQDKALRQLVEGGLPNEVTALANDRLFWRRGSDAWITNAALTQLESQPKLNLPKIDGVPWAVVFSKLHSGSLIYSEWKWVNDFFAFLAFVLIVTGAIRWWKKKWLHTSTTAQQH